MGPSVSPSSPRSIKGVSEPSRSPPTSPKSKSPRPVDSPISVTRARRNLIKHLEGWSLHRQANCNFFGKIYVKAPASWSEKPYALGEAVICELVPHESSRVITMVMRLFAHQNQYKYHMTIRCGAGWEDERTWFLRQHQKEQKRQGSGLSQSTPIFGARTPDDFCVTVRPLFNQFSLLPIELQQRVFAYAMGGCDEVNPGLSTHQTVTVRAASFRTVTLPTILTLSRSIKFCGTPWFYRTTTFHFGTQHLTNFLHRIGPSNRRELRKLSFSFGRTAISHVARFFTPDQVFTLFEPPLSAQQHFWRLQLHDTMREVNLAVLIIKVDSMIKRDVSAVEKSLVACFRSVDRVRFQDDSKPVDAVTVGAGKTFEKSWFQHTQDIFERYCKGQESGHIFGKKQRRGTVEELEKEMEGNLGFFNS